MLALTLATLSCVTRGSEPTRHRNVVPIHDPKRQAFPLNILHPDFSDRPAVRPMRQPAHSEEQVRREDDEDHTSFGPAARYTEQCDGKRRLAPTRCENEAESASCGQQTSVADEAGLNVAEFFAKAEADINTLQDAGYD
jgi:hypothetical protein